MRISDWSSDVCSSDLARRRRGADGHGQPCQGPCRQGRDPDLRGQGRGRTDLLTGGTAPGWAEERWTATGRPTGERQCNASPSTCQARKSVVWGKSVAVSVDHGGGRILEKKNIN